MSLPASPAGEAPRRPPLAPPPAAALVALIVLAGAGIGFAPRLVPDRHGAPAPPALVLEAALPGLGADVVESALTLPLEQAAAEAPGLQEIEARSLPGRAELLLAFTSPSARDAAPSALNERLPEIARAAGALLPPTIAALDRSAVPAAIYRVSVRASPDAALQWLQSVLADGLRALPHVAEVAVAGSVQREIRVQADMGRLAALALTVDDLIVALRDELGAGGRRGEAPVSVQALAAAAVRLAGGEPAALAELAELAVVEVPARASTGAGDAELRIIVRADAAHAREVAGRVHDHLAWLAANGLVPPNVALVSQHNEARAASTWRTRVLARIGFGALVMLAFLGLVFGLRFAAVAALGFGAWLPAALASLALLGFSLDLPVAAGLLAACVPFVLLMLLPRPGVVYLLALAGAALLWGAMRALGAAAGIGSALAVAVLLAGPVRWLVGPWLQAPRAHGPLGRPWGGAPGALPTRAVALVVAMFVLAAAGVSIYALPAVQAGATEGEFRLRLVGGDRRQIALVAGWLTAGLHAIPRVVEVNSTAALVERWRLRLDSERMTARGITAAEVGRAFAVAHEGLIVGEVVSDDARIPVRLRLVPGAAGPDFERLLLRPGDRSESPLYLQDVGAAERAVQPRARLRVNGLPAVEIRARWHGRTARSALLRFCRRLRIPDDHRAQCGVSDARS